MNDSKQVRITFSLFSTKMFKTKESDGKDLFESTQYLDEYLDDILIISTILLQNLNYSRPSKK